MCRLKSPAINLERVDSAGRSTLKIFVGSDLYVAAVIQAQGSFVTYNGSLCTPKPSLS